MGGIRRMRSLSLIRTLLMLRKTLLQRRRNNSRNFLTNNYYKYYLCFICISYCCDRHLMVWELMIFIVPEINFLIFCKLNTNERVNANIYDDSLFFPKVFKSKVTFSRS